jgi:hypothetical protein
VQLDGVEGLGGQGRESDVCVVEGGKVPGRMAIGMAMALEAHTRCRFSWQGAWARESRLGTGLLSLSRASHPHNGA